MQCNKFMRFCGRFLIVGLCLLFVAAAQSLTAASMYMVDYKLLVALHPKMSGYDMVIERFLRPDINPNDGSFAALEAKSADLAIKIGKELEPAYDKLALLNGQIEGLMYKTGLEERDMCNLAGLAKKSSGVKQAQINKLAVFKKELDELKNYIEAKNDEILSPMYLSKPQTQQRVEEVLDEIDLILNDFSRSLSGALIIDSDYTALQQSPTVFHGCFADKIDPLSLSVYQQILSGQSSNSICDVYRNTQGGVQSNINALSQAYSEDKMRTDINNQIAQSPLLAKTVGLHGRLVLQGGEDIDLTKRVLERIFQRYSIRNDVALRIMNLIR